MLIFHCVGSLAFTSSIAVVEAVPPPPLAAAATKPAASTSNPIYNHVLDDSSSDARIAAVSPDATVAASPLAVFTLSGENE